MNKVVNIELAGQVFWIEENAYLLLQEYLEKIKRQLAKDECADEITKDIELRIAELFYGMSNGKNKSISLVQLEDVISQIGYIEGVAAEADVASKAPKKSFRDPENKILGGVCAGLATRFGVPAFILRVVFLATALVFGLGVALYLIFWISLDLRVGRNASLAAEGRAATAKRIAEYEQPKPGAMVQLQRIIFLPVSILGMLVSVIGNHFKRRQNGYLFIFKNLVFLALIFLTAVFCAGLYEFNYNRLFFWTYSWLLSASAMYLVVLILAIYVCEYYLIKPKIKVKKNLKVGALIPIAIIATGIYSLNNAHTDHHIDASDRQLIIQNSELELIFDDTRPKGKFSERVDYKVLVSGNQNSLATMNVEYVSHGSSLEDAKVNTRYIDFAYGFSEGKLTLNKYWTLKDDAINRGQSVSVTIVLPQHITLRSNKSLTVDLDDSAYQYHASYYDSEPTTYLVKNEFLHEIGESFSNRLSDNEREVLNYKFCAEFFISDLWYCNSNIRRQIDKSSRFDQAFKDDSEVIESIRQHLQPNRSLFVSKLTEINELIKGISVQYPVKSDLQQYVEHLIKVKSPQELATNSSSN